MRLFADDSLVYSIIQSERDRAILQEDLHQLELWEEKWQMQFNADKCEVIRITKKRKPITGSYTIRNQQLQTVNNAKYLGATISSDLSWNQHVNNTVKKATNSLNFLGRNIHDCPTKIKEQCYKMLVRPVTDYASCIYGIPVRRPT